MSSGLTNKFVPPEGIIYTTSGDQELRLTPKLRSEADREEVVSCFPLRILSYPLNQGNLSFANGHISEGRNLTRFLLYHIIFSRQSLLKPFNKMNRRSGGTRGSEDDFTPAIADLLPSSTPSLPYLPPYLPNSLSMGGIPSSTQTAYMSTRTVFSTSTHKMNEAAPVSTSTSTVSPVVTAGPSAGISQVTQSQSPWEKLRQPVQSAVIVIVVLGVCATVGISVWFCCGGKRKWKKTTNSAGRHDAGRLPLHTVHRRSVHEPIGAVQVAGGEAPPPRYELVVPPQHQRLAGGVSHVRDEAEDGMVADGKTPLSEIPFEDIMLDHHSTAGSSSSQSFPTRHHAGRGDTTGHTNS